MQLQHTSPISIQAGEATYVNNTPLELKIMSLPQVPSTVIFCVVAALGILFYFSVRAQAGSPGGRSLVENRKVQGVTFAERTRRGLVWDSIRSAVLGKDEKPSPQLSEDQELWIAASVLRAENGGKKAEFLVWGLGYDSRVWDKVNRGGRTVFLEQNQKWMDIVLKDYPHLEAYQVEYQATIATADSFFSDPWLVSLPPAVSNACYDVILIDAPEGFTPQKPGRMESSHWSIENAKSCVERGKKKQVVLFLHDVNRGMEQQIMSKLFESNPRMTKLGLMKGPAGDLVRYVFK